MKRNGFTLIELLIAVALIAVLTTSISIGITQLLNRQKEKRYEEYKLTIENDACVYANTINLRDTCADKNNCIKTVSTNDLILNGTLDETMINPENGLSVGVDHKIITVRWSDGEKTCTYPEV